MTPAQSLANNAPPIITMFLADAASRRSETSCKFVVPIGRTLPTTHCTPIIGAECDANKTLCGSKCRRGVVHAFAHASHAATVLAEIIA